MAVPGLQSEAQILYQPQHRSLPLSGYHQGRCIRIYLESEHVYICSKMPRRGLTLHSPVCVPRLQLVGAISSLAEKTINIYMISSVISLDTSKDNHPI